MLESNHIYHGRCEDLITKITDESVDLVITSPPYNVDLGKNKFNKNPYDLYNDNKDHKEYISWLKDIFHAIKYKLVHGGRVCINIGDSQNGRVPTHSDIIQFMVHDLKYIVKSVIIWDKSQIGNRLAWGSWKSPSNPSFPCTYEYILVFCNESQYKEGDKKDITISREEFIHNSIAMWRFPGEQRMNKKYGHPAMFPIELPYRLIQHLSYKGDLVLDPFSGMGTTCLAAENSGRKWMGFELSEEYADASIKRLNQEIDQEKIF